MKGRSLLACFFLLLIFNLGCSPAARRNVAKVAAVTIRGAAAGASGNGGAGYETAKLMLFGGTDHKTYLGCLNCSEYASDSVLNQYGEYGSSYSSSSIWNSFSEYGSAYSNESACSPYAADPPVIVDQTGKFYGRLTVNKYNTEIGLGARYYNWLVKTVCQ